MLSNDTASSPATRIFECLRCSLPCTRASNSQKYCRDCRQSLKIEWGRQSEARRLAVKGGPRVNIAIECANCGSLFNKITGLQKLCSECRRIQKKKYHQEKQRLYKGTTLPLGSEMKCQGCELKIIKRSGLQKFCQACSDQTQRIGDRDRYRAKQNREIAVLGEIMPCKRCGIEIERRGALQKFCEPCRALEQTERARVYQLKRVARSPASKLNVRLGSAIARSLRGAKLGKHWEDLVGYTIHQLMEHLEKLFAEGMSFENYGTWHVDHVRPISSFVFQTPDDPQFKAAWRLENLQPLWALDNIRKSAKYDMEMHA